MPRSLGQALAFLLGFWLALSFSPFSIEIARADSDTASIRLARRHFQAERVGATVRRLATIPLRDPSGAAR